MIVPMLYVPILVFFVVWFFFFFSSRRRHTRCSRDWSSDVCSSDLIVIPEGGAGALAFGDGALWVAGGIIGRLSRIDPRTNAVTTPARDLGKWTCCIAVGGGYVWAAVGGTLWKISEDGQVVSSKKVPASIAGLRYAEG